MTNLAHIWYTHASYPWFKSFSVLSSQTRTWKAFPSRTFENISSIMLNVRIKTFTNWTLPISVHFCSQELSPNVIYTETLSIYYNTKHTNIIYFVSYNTNNHEFYQKILKILKTPKCQLKSRQSQHSLNKDGRAHAVLLNVYIFLLLQCKYH